MKTLHLKPIVGQYFNVAYPSLDLYASISIGEDSFRFTFQNIERRFFCLESIRLTNNPDGYVIRYKYPKDWILSPKIIMTIARDNLNIWSVCMFDENPSQKMYVIFSDEEVRAIRETLQVI